MCGLVGVAGHLMHHEKAAFKHLLILDAIRGEDSTGVFMVEKANHKGSIVKEIGHPFYLFRDHKDSFDDKGLPKISPALLMGHNRFATTGKVAIENAHPFHIDKIVGAHNGTLEKAWLKELDDWADYDVDSQVIFHNINKHGVKAINKVAGAYALTWYNLIDCKLNFIRNEKRPLYYCRSKDKDTFWWASEEWMLFVALNRANIAFDEITPFAVDHHYSIDLNKPYDFKKEQLVDEGVVKGFTIPPVRHIMTGGGKTTGNIGTNSHVPIFKKTPSQDNHTPPSLANGKELKSLVGQTIHFYVYGPEKGDSRVEYLKCLPANTGDKYEIRIYADGKGKAIWNDMKNSSRRYKAIVKKIARFNNRGVKREYILPDLRTIDFATYKDLVPQKEDSIPFVDDSPLPPDFIKGKGKGASKPIVGFDGRFLTPDEFYKCTCDGCAWCSTGVTVKEHDMIEWLGHKEFLCNECKGIEEARFYITMGKN